MELVPFDLEGLTVEWTTRAEVEFGETEERKCKAILDFRKMVEAQNDIYCRLDDLFLLRFIRLKKFDLKKALKVLRTYCNYQTKYAGVYTCLKPSKGRKVIDMNVLCFAPYRLPRGPHIAILRMASFDWEAGCSVHDLIAAVVLIDEIVMQYEATQLFGACLIFDLGRVSFAQYLRFISFSVFKFAITALQDCCWPMKIDSMHVINEPPWMWPIYTLLKPLMKEKLRNRVIFHGDKMESLHEHVPPQYLPKELGGTLEAVFKRFVSFFADHEPYLETLVKYGFEKK